MMSNTSELLPEPETLVNTVSWALRDLDGNVLQVALAARLHAG